MVRRTAKVTIDSLSEVIYEKSEINWYKRNAIDLCLEVVVRSWQHCDKFAVEYLGNR